MSLPANTNIQVKSSDLFTSSKWRLCILKNEFARGRQATEPLIIVTGDKNIYLYGQAHKLRADNRMLDATHLDSEKILQYIEKYDNNNHNNAPNEPKNQFLSIKHKEYQSGGLSLESVKPLMTQQQWARRDPMAILLIKNETQKHLLKRKESQLRQVQSKESENIIMDLERNVQDSYDHILTAFIRNLFHQNMYYRKRKTIVNSNGSIYVTIAPKLFHEKIKPLLLEFGGIQVCYKANHESWKAQNLTHDSLKIILNQGRDLSVTDEKGHEYTPSDGEIYYNINNCRLIVKYMPVVSNDGVFGNQRRQHKRK